MNTVTETKTTTVTDTKKYLNLAEMGELLGLSAGTVRRRVTEGVWPHSRPGNKILFGPQDIADIQEIIRRPPLPRRSRVRKRNT